MDGLPRFPSKGEQSAVIPASEDRQGGEKLERLLRLFEIPTLQVTKEVEIQSRRSLLKGSFRVIKGPLYFYSHVPNGYFAFGNFLVAQGPPQLKKVLRPLSRSNLKGLQRQYVATLGQGSYDACHIMGDEVVQPMVFSILTSEFVSVHAFPCLRRLGPRLESAAAIIRETQACTLKNLFDLKSQVSLVTEGSSELGLQIAEAVGEMGARVVVAAPNAGELQQAAAHLQTRGIEAMTVVSDLQHPSQVAPLVDEVLKAYNQIEILVNNAGASLEMHAGDDPDDAWHKVMNLSVNSSFFVVPA
ncbi:SDR family NAD(P)-dependent oxidoreductase [Paraburkholderia fungorum]|uniref:SDR family NAD(P)-dependent oxidoreductase n=1 Tax=Paraburkholderia fungorum TaxID=134537 RepID=UPI0038B8DA0A